MHIKYQIPSLWSADSIITCIGDPKNFRKRKAGRLMNVSGLLYKN